MFFKPLSQILLLRTWHEFQIKLRWRIYFLLKEGLDVPYDPERGERRYVQRTAASTQIETPFAPEVDRIYRYLNDNDFSCRTRWPTTTKLVGF